MCKASNIHQRDGGLCVAIAKVCRSETASKSAFGRNTQNKVKEVGSMFQTGDNILQKRYVIIIKRIN